MNLHLYRCEACGIVRALEVPPLDRRCPEQMLEVRGGGEVGFTRCRGLLTTLTLGDFLTTTAGAVSVAEPLIDIGDGQSDTDPGGSLRCSAGRAVRLHHVPRIGNYPACWRQKHVDDDTICDHKR